MATRFVIEGEWSGYRPAQQRCVHRTAHSVKERQFRKFVESMQAIEFTDGTHLWLSVRDAKPRERIKQIHGYDSLIRACYVHGVSCVVDLPKST